MIVKKAAIINLKLSLEPESEVPADRGMLRRELERIIEAGVEKTGNKFQIDILRVELSQKDALKIRLKVHGDVEIREDFELVAERGVKEIISKGRQETKEMAIHFTDTTT